MARPKSNRMIAKPPEYWDFRPSAIPKNAAKLLFMTLDEFEALRLADGLDKSHEDAASEMGISRPTFTRLVDRARKKSIQYLLQGRRLIIGDGPVHFKQNIYRCDACHDTFTCSMERRRVACPTCGSTGITDLAAGFGHGECCSHVS